MRLGDAVATVTRLLKIKQCDPCRQRQERLNKITVWPERKT